MKTGRQKFVANLAIPKFGLPGEQQYHRKYHAKT